MIHRIRIGGCPNGLCSLPWFVFDGIKVTAAGVELEITRCTGPAASAVARAQAEARGRPDLARAYCQKTVTATKERAIKGVWNLTYDLTAPKEIHVLAVTLDGAVEFVPRSKQRPEYYAHLGEVDPVSGDVRLLEFEDEVGAHDA